MSVQQKGREEKQSEVCSCYQVCLILAFVLLGNPITNTGNPGMDTLLSTVDMRVSTLDMHVSTLDRRVSKLSKNI